MSLPKGRQCWVNEHFDAALHPLSHIRYTQSIRHCSNVESQIFTPKYNIFLACLQDLDVWKHHQVDAFVIVYSMTDRRSFGKAVDLLYDMRVLNQRKEAIMLVANKTDLVRGRIVSEKGRIHATTSSQTNIRQYLPQIIAKIRNE